MTIKEQEIIEGNKMIAEFMGGEYKITDPGNKKWSMMPSGSIKYLPSHFEIDAPYHASWDWLIPVIDKIYGMDIYYRYKNETGGQFESGIFINTKFISVTWEQIADFIEWYNNHKN